MPPGETLPEFSLVRDLAIIMAGAGLVVVLCRRLNQPAILGYLLAGLLIGPFTLPHPLITNVETIGLLADLGLVLLLFALGLEFGWWSIREVGLTALVVGSVEMLVMISLGYGVGKLFGWTGQESIFLGAALSISSSAILVKVLRDTGRLLTTAGHLIVGILVVEDFAAVVLLSILSGIATPGAAESGDVVRLLLKLAIFAAASLGLGALLVPRIIRFVARFGSQEIMLLSSLALCFVLTLVGQSLGISPAAGAFLMGTVVGDTEESHQIADIIAPIRDMFGAVFFVSIGMLIDVRMIKDYLVPTAVLSLLFIAGKVLGNSLGTFATGRKGRVSLRVGMGMPQIGEFSLAIMKVGVENNAIGAFLYQVIAGVTAITSLVYPYVARSADQLGVFLERRSPTLLRRSVASLSVVLQLSSSGLRFDTEFARRSRRAAIPMAINLLIIVVLLGTGTFAVRVASEIGKLVGISGQALGNIIGLTTLLLCVPSAVALWRSLENLAEAVAAHLVLRHRLFRTRARERLRALIRDSVLVLMLAVLTLWSLPLISELLALGSLVAPLPLLILVALIFLAIRLVTRIQSHLTTSFGQTFFGGAGPVSPAGTTSPQAPTPGSAPEPAPAAAPAEVPVLQMPATTPGEAAPSSPVPPAEAEVRATPEMEPEGSADRRRVSFLLLVVVGIVLVGVGAGVWAFLL